MTTTDNQCEGPESLFEKAKRFYFPTQGMDPDPELALALFRKSASLGYAPAQRLLGICLLEGTYCARDLDQARFWLSEAAAANDPQASLSLALVYAKGMGTAKRWDLAWRLLSRPEAEALPEARELKMKLKSELVSLYPAVSGAVSGAEKVRRALLTRHQARFIAPFWPVGRLEGIQPEYFALLDLNLGKIAPEAAMARIGEAMEAYYSEMTVSCPAAPSGARRP
ncbi:MAG: sel1 repeat family protein [Deltaproteobacteria bacterium]|nr:sel1 repeat family protein [Deltaproteobacteria bacterium]